MKARNTLIRIALALVALCILATSATPALGQESGYIDVKALKTRVHKAIEINRNPDRAPQGDPITVTNSVGFAEAIAVVVDQVSYPVQPGETVTIYLNGTIGTLCFYECIDLGGGEWDCHDDCNIVVAGTAYEVITDGPPVNMSLTPPGPAVNLAVASFTGPATAYQFEDITSQIALSIENTSTIDLGPVSVEIVVATDALLTENVSRLSLTDVPLIGAGQTVPVPLASTVVGLIEGGRFLGARIDPSNLIPEDDETDNQASQAVTIAPDPNEITAYYEDFQEGEASWFPRDLTGQDVYWTRMTDSYGGTPRGVWWCGDNNPNWVTPPGYGDSWNQHLTRAFTLSDTTPVTMTYTLQYDVEPGYDYVDVKVSNDGGNSYVTLMSYDGNSSGYITDSVDLSAWAGQFVYLRFTVRSDGAWSDEDGQWPTDGALRLDEVQVSGYDPDTFEDGALDPAGGWIPSAEPPTGGAFRLEEFPVCIAPDTLCGETGLGHPTCNAWVAYDPYTYRFPTWEVLPPYTRRSVEIAIESPTIDIPADGSRYYLEYDIWSDLPMIEGVFYTEEIAIPAHGNFQSIRNFVYYGASPTWTRARRDITHLMQPDATTMKIRLIAIDMEPYWGGMYVNRTQTTTAPIFDNVAVRVWGSSETWLDLSYYPRECGASDGDVDGDGVSDGIDVCPGQNAADFDSDGDGCIDDVIGARHIEYWSLADLPLEYYIHEDGAPGITDGSDFLAVQSGFDAWAAVPGSDVTVNYLGAINQAAANAYDGINTVTFSDTEFDFPPGVLAVGVSTSFVWPTEFQGEIKRPGQIVDTDMMFNPLVAFQTPSMGVGTDIQGIATHEAGHMFGISHSAVITSTMFYVLPPGVNATTLQIEDELMMTKAYPQASVVTGTGRIRGTVTSGYTGDPVPGAIVFVIDPAGPDTVGCEYTMPDDGSFDFVALADGDYQVSIYPLNGTSPIGFLSAEYINRMIFRNAVIDFPPESWDLGESSGDDPAVADLVTVTAGTTTPVNFITNIDVTGPSVTIVYPAPGQTDVAIDAAVLIKFDEAIDGNSLAGNFRWERMPDEQHVPGNAALVNDDSTLAYVTRENLQFSTEYRLELGAGVTDLYGNEMGSPYIMTVTTEVRPPVALSNLAPSKGMPGAIVAINGSGFDIDPSQNLVSFGAVPLDVQRASQTQLIVEIPPGTTPAADLIGVVNLVTGHTSNTLNFVVLEPTDVARSVETAVVSQLGLPRAMLLTLDGDYAFVATDAGLTAVVVDDVSPDYLSHTPVAIANGLNDLDLTPDGRFVYAVGTLNQKIYRFNADPGAGPIGPLNELSLNAEPRGIMVDRAGRRAFIPTSGGEILVWDVQKSSGTFEEQIGVITSPDPGLTGVMTTDPAGDYLLALSSAGKVLVFDLGPDTLLATVEVQQEPRDIVVDPTGERAYVTDGAGYVSIVSLSSFAKIQDIPTGGSLEGCAITAAGSFLYAANYELDDFDVIDLRENSPTWRMIATRIPQRANPVDISFSSDGHYAYSIIESGQQLVVTAMGEGAVLTTVSPQAGAEGAVLTFAGSGFTDAGPPTVSFNGVNATPVRLSDNSLAVAVPAGASSGPVSVVGTPPGSPTVVSNALYFEVLGASGDGALKQAASAVPAGAPPLTAALAVSPDGNAVAVGGEDGHLYLLDTGPNSSTYHTFTLDAPAFTSPVADVVITPDASTALVSADETTVFIYNVDTESPDFGSVKNLIVFGAGGIGNLAVSPDGVYLLASEPGAANVHLATIATTVFTTTSILDAAPNLNGVVGEMAYHPGGAVAYLTVRDDDPATVVVLDTDPANPTFGDVAGSVALPGGTPSEVPISLAFSPDGSKCYVLTSQETGVPNRTVITLDTSNPAAPAVTASDAFATTAVAMDEFVRVSPRGDRAVLNIRDDGFFHVDVTTSPGMTVLDQLGGAALTDAIDFAFSPDGNRMYAVSSALDEVAVYDFNAAQEMAIVFGNGQTGVIAEPLASPLRIRVVDIVTGDGWPGVPVTFVVFSGGGHFTLASNPGATPVQLVVPTGQYGYAQVDWTLGPSTGDQQIEASALGIAGSPRVFTATAIADPELLPLHLAWIAPEHQLSGVSITTATQAAFTRPVDPDFPVESFFLTDDGGVTTVPTVRGFAGNNTRVSLTPIEPLEHNTTYQLVLTAGIVDAGGGPLDNPQITTFTTGPPPPLNLASVFPPSGTANVGIVLSGSGFDPVYANNTVLFNAISVTPTDGAQDYLNVTVPFGAESGWIAVVTNGVTSDAVPFQVLIPSTSAADEVIATVKTGSATKAVTVSPDGAMGYAVSPEADLVIPFDLTTFTTLPGIPVGLRPWAITVHPDGQNAYVINRLSGDMSIIDLDPASPDYHKVTSSVEVGIHPVDLVVAGAGDRVIVANASSSDLSVIDSDQSSETFHSVIATVKTGTAVKAVTTSPDGGRLYVGTDDGYIVLETIDYGVIATVSTGKGTRTVTISPDGGLLILLDALGDIYIYDVVPESDKENQVIATVKTGSGAKGVTVSPDGALLFVVENEGDQILVIPLEVPTSISVIKAPDASLGPLELTPIATLTAGENPQMVAFDPTGSGVFYVPNAGDNTISVFDKAPEPQGPGVLAGQVTTECTGASVGLIGIEIDMFSYATGDMVVSMLTDESGYYTAELPCGDYTVSVVTPLGFTIASEESLVTVLPEATTTVDFILTCEANPPAPRKTAFWKHQLGVALRGHGHFDIDGPALCGYLDQIDTHFNNHRMNPVIVYEPPPSGECGDKLQVAKDLFNLKGKLTEFDKARSQFMALLFNVASGKLNLWDPVSEDGVKVSKAITYIDILLQDGDDSNDMLARKIARDINGGKLIEAGVIPESLPDIQYAPRNLEWDLAQNYPNPFNPSTTIRYEIKEAVHVKLRVYDVAGRLVRTLVDETRKPDRYKAVWNGTNNRGQSVATGVYFYRLEAGSFVSTKKMVLLK